MKNLKLKNECNKRAFCWLISQNIFTAVRHSAHLGPIDHKASWFHLIYTSTSHQTKRYLTWKFAFDIVQVYNATRFTPTRSVLSS
jgi:hypothetical protein